jgi:hypothetical protein
VTHGARPDRGDGRSRRELPYVTLEVDDHLHRRVRYAADRVRINLRSHLLSAADDVDAAGDEVRGTCDAVVSRVDDVAAKVGDRTDPAARQSAGESSRVEAHWRHLYGVVTG